MSIDTELLAGLPEELRAQVLAAANATESKAKPKGKGKGKAPEATPSASTAAAEYLRLAKLGNDAGSIGATIAESICKAEGITVGGKVGITEARANALAREAALLKGITEPEEGKVKGTYWSNFTSEAARRLRTVHLWPGFYEWHNKTVPDGTPDHKTGCGISRMTRYARDYIDAGCKGTAESVVKARRELDKKAADEKAGMTDMQKAGVIVAKLVHNKKLDNNFRAALFVLSQQYDMGVSL